MTPHVSFPVSATALLLVLFGLVGPVPAEAQPEPNPDSAQGWQNELAATLSGTQAAYREWQEGGLNTLSFTSSVNGTAERKQGRWTQTHDLRLAFGLITTEGDEAGEPIRKADDQIQAESILRYAGSGFLRLFKPTVSARLRTQFSKRFDYSENPYPTDHPLAGLDPPVQTSEFFAPAYLVQTLGLTYAPKDWYKVRLSAASKQTVVRDPRLRVLYDVSSDKTARAEAGGELAATLDRAIADNVEYKSNMVVFYSVNQLETPPDARWENYITMRVNSWLTANVEFVALFDDNTSSAIQLKEVLSLGVTIDLL